MEKQTHVRSTELVHSSTDRDNPTKSNRGSLSQPSEHTPPVHRRMSTESHSASSELRPEILQIHKCNSGSWSSFSYTGNDLISFEDGTSTTESSTRPPSATSHLEDSSQCTDLRVKSIKSHSVYVTISGTSYAVPQDIFANLQNLNWLRDRDGHWLLNTSPAIFDILLGYMIFETLPAIDTLSKAEYDEFEPMALSLGLFSLVQHFDRSSDRRLRTKGHRSSLKQKHKGTPIILNSENVSVVSVKLMDVNNKCARFVASLKLKASKRLRNRRTKLTHDQWCASDHVV